MKRAFTLVEILIVVVVLAIIAAFLSPIFTRSRENAHGPSCGSNLRQIGLGFIQYEQDYDERFPAARATSSIGWADLLQPYVKSTQIFQCPQGQNAAPGFATDYFYNRRLARVTMAQVNVPPLTILSGDGDDDAPTWNSWAGLPGDAATNSDSPAQRHKGFANYLFADGHVKALVPTAVSSTIAAPTSRATFAFR